MAFYDGPGDQLAHNLSQIIDEYQADREWYWEEDPLTKSFVRAFDVLSEALLAASGNLVVEPFDTGGEGGDVVSPWDDVTRIAGEHGMDEQLAESVQICIAREAVDKLPKSTSRCLELTAYVLSEQPGEPVRKFLARLGRCYIAGFMPECVILCRGVLENAVKEAFQRRQEAFTGSKMSDRLRRAVELEWLTEQEYRNGMTVWTRGNKAVHDDPEATKDVLGTIKLTVGVIQQLYGSGS